MQEEKFNKQDGNLDQPNVKQLLPSEEWHNVYERFKEYQKNISVKLSNFDYTLWMMTEYEAPKKRGNVV